MCVEMLQIRAKVDVFSCRCFYFTIHNTFEAVCDVVIDMGC